MIVVLKEDEMDEEFDDSVEDVNDMVVEVMELSLFSFFWTFLTNNNEDM